MATDFIYEEKTYLLIALEGSAYAAGQPRGYPSI